MDINVHDPVVHRADHAGELVAVPCRDNGAEVPHRDDEFVGEMSA